DLKLAKQLLANDYSYSMNERTRVNKFTAAALLSRVYLHLKDWNSSETESSYILDNTDIFGLEVDLNNVFVKNSREAIWQFMSLGGAGYTYLGSSFNPASSTVI